jgi:3-(3-hydroxy-phenyl)propionate hydroxylase
MFPQPGVDDGHRRLRLDDVLGDGAWLFTTTPTKATAPGVRILPLEAEDLILFRYQLRTWLDRTGAPAVLVRPDRYVFGAGEPDMLLRRWREALEAPEMAEA